MSLFAGLREATPSKGGVYFQPGKFIVEVLGVKLIKSQKDRRDFFVIETEVVASNRDAQAAGLRVGTKPSQAIDMGNVMAMPNIKGFLAAASGIEPDVPDLNEQIEATWSALTGVQMTVEQCAERVIAHDNPLQGVTLYCEAVEIKTRANEPFTKVTWYPLPQEGSAAYNKILAYFE